jgi:hypothetical protein
MPSFPILSSVIRAAMWRRFSPALREPHPASVIALALLASGAGILLERALGGEASSFQLYGVNSALLGSVVTIALVSLFAPFGQRSASVAIVLGLSILSSLVLAGLVLAAAQVFPNGSDSESWLPLIFWMAVMILIVVWMIGAVATVLRSLDPGTARRPVLRSVGVPLGTLMALVLLPSWPTFIGKDFNSATANIWELISAATASNEPPANWTAREESAASIEMAQPALMESKIGGLAARRDAENNIFVLGIAGSNTETVFETEIKASLDVLNQRFNTQDRSILLVNPRKAFPRLDPVASISNMSVALRAIGQRMDKDRDILILALTSHGSKAGFALNFGSVVDRTLTPFTLQTMLDIAGIKNRIIIVSACYSGVFVPKLADENTVVITASSATANSFGCSNERDWTYFGDAFFNQALRTAPTLSAAFEQAKALVSEWEKRDGLTPSQPQIHVGAKISQQFPMVGLPETAPAERSAAVVQN